MYVVHTSSEIAYATMEPVVPPPGFQVTELVAPSIVVSRVKELYRIVQGRIVPKCVVGLYPERDYLVADGTNQVVIEVRLSLRQPEDAFTSVPLLVDGAPTEVPLDGSDRGTYAFTTTVPGEHLIQVPPSDTFAPSQITLHALRP